MNGIAGQGDNGEDVGDGQRDFLRLTLGLVGEMETLNGKRRVEILDLSQGGAQVVLADPANPGRYEIRDCVLRWMEFEAFGEVRRNQDGHYGIAFDEPLRPGVIKATRTAASLNVRRDFLEHRQHARLWAHGIRNP